MYTSYFAYTLSVDGHLRYFHILTIVCDAAVSVDTQPFLRHTPAPTTKALRNLHPEEMGLAGGEDGLHCPKPYSPSAKLV